MMSRYDGPMCSLSATLVITGERWSFLILREALMGVSRFSEFRANLGVAPDVLSGRLAKLTEKGLLVRQEYRESGTRSRHSYHLTASGRELSIALSALQRWGDEHLESELGPGARFETRDGQGLSVEFVTEDGEVVPSTDVVAVRVPLWTDSDEKQETEPCRHDDARAILSGDPHRLSAALTRAEPAEAGR